MCTDRPPCCPPGSCTPQARLTALLVINVERRPADCECSVGSEGATPPRATHDGHGHARAAKPPEPSAQQHWVRGSTQPAPQHSVPGGQQVPSVKSPTQQVPVHGAKPPFPSGQQLCVKGSTQPAPQHSVPGGQQVPSVKSPTQHVPVQGAKLSFPSGQQDCVWGSTQPAPQHSVPGGQHVPSVKSPRQHVPQHDEPARGEPVGN